METVQYEGWRCGRITNGSLTAYVTLDVGPRITGLHYEDAPNLFFIKPETRGATDLTGYNGYGGHRLWVAPEIVSRTYEPENDPVETWEGAVHDENCPSMKVTYGFRSPVGPSMLEKTVFLTPFDGGIEVAHQITNAGPVAQEVAPWAISVMRPGGECLIPGHGMSPFPTNEKLPTRPLVLWPYTDLTDPRYTWSKEVVRLHQNPLVDGHTKFGAFVRQGIAIYAIDGLLFVKRFGSEVSSDYPDFGCNFEAYTRHDMLEVETLGPVRRIGTGETTFHYESWFVFERDVPDTNFTAWFEELNEETGALRFKGR